MFLFKIFGKYQTFMQESFDVLKNPGLSGSVGCDELKIPGAFPACERKSQNVRPKEKRKFNI